jgi:predicted metalloprotease with PDZ domain
VIRSVTLAIVIALAAQCATQDWLAASPKFGASYTISLADPSNHLVKVKIELPPGPPERDLQLPVWYALYQVRDFAQHVRGMRVTNGPSVSVRKLEASKWRIDGAENGAEVEYEVFADDPGAFGAELNSHHAFFNLAEILMYPADGHDPVQIRFANIPSGWKTATVLPATPNGFAARSYDDLVDSPVEISAFEESDFDENGGHYRVIVDAVHGEYDMNSIAPMVRRIVNSATSWMNDRPFSTYAFFYHFAYRSGGGGMEHANGAAIAVSAETPSNDVTALAAITAHEFFHLWNVKRIRPQSLEPIDYSKANYTTALWFSEGVTNTVEEYILLRAGLLDERGYLERLGKSITELENRPAHLTQSVEESSLDTWMERYSYYQRPERSISYYNKGELLGVLLDLKLRDATNGATSLRDLFQWMNTNYARKGRYFEDSEGVRRAAETISHARLKSFFDKYVAGTDEIAWNDYFSTVGLQLVAQSAEIADAGFVATRNFDSPLAVISVAENSRAEKAGIAEGDIILEVNGEMAPQDLEPALAGLHPGDKLKIRVRNRSGDHELSWKLGAQQEVVFRLKDLASVTPSQMSRRAAWLKGESEVSGEARQ